MIYDRSVYDFQRNVGLWWTGY